MNSMILVVHISRTNDAVKPGLDFLVTDNGNSTAVNIISCPSGMNDVSHVLQGGQKVKESERARLQSPLHAPSSFQAVKAYSQTLKLSETLGKLSSQVNIFAAHFSVHFFLLSVVHCIVYHHYYILLLFKDSVLFCPIASCSSHQTARP